MPIIRNPFRRAVEPVIIEENARPTPISRTSSDTKPLDIKSQEAEYKLSEISDNGVYLPPSPTEKKSFWSSRSSISRHSSHRNVLNEDEHFNISRESFDSYRRSFDISAKTPVIEQSPSNRPRQSLDVRHMRFPSSQSFSTQTSFSAASTPSLTSKPSYSFQTPRFHTPSAEAREPSSTPDLSPKIIQANPPPGPPEDPADEAADKFEEVGLHDAIKPKRHGIFARFSGNTSTPTTTDTHHTEPRPSSGGGMMSHSFFGRKRGASGTGSELNSMSKPGPRPSTPGKNAPATTTAATPSTPVAALQTPTQTPSRTQTPVPEAAAVAPPPPPPVMEMGTMQDVKVDG